MMGHIIGSFVMMRLGSFKFAISTAAYQEFMRRTEYKWAAQELFMQHDDLQFTGPGGDVISLSGVIFPEFRGGTGQVAALRSLAAQGRPQLLVSGLGDVMGHWVIESIEEGQTVFAAAGVPRRQEFTVHIRKYGDGFAI